MVSPNAPAKLDDADRRLLAQLQRNNRLSNLQLAHLTRLSPATTLRRVRELRQNGTIIADVSIVAPAALGRPLFVFVEIVLERQSEGLVEAFERKVRDLPEVTQCYLVSGEADFLLLIQVQDMHSYERFVRSVFGEDDNVKKYKSLFSIHRSKFSTCLAC